MLELLILILTDAILYVIIRMVYSHQSTQKESVALSYSFLLLGFCCVAHGAATWTMRTAELNGWKILVASAGFGAIPIAAYVHLLMSNPAIDAIVRGTSHAARARRLRVDGNIEGALDAYNKAFEEDPSVPLPLLAAAAMMLSEGQHDGASELYEKVRASFKEDKAVWADATWRMSNMLEKDLDDKSGAIELLYDFLREVPDHELIDEAVKRISNLKLSLPEE